MDACAQVMIFDFQQYDEHKRIAKFHIYSIFAIKLLFLLMWQALWRMVKSRTYTPMQQREQNHKFESLLMVRTLYTRILN